MVSYILTRLGDVALKNYVALVSMVIADFMCEMSISIILADSGDKIGF